MSKQEQGFTMTLKGIANDAHENFPIKFDYGQNGGAYFVGCRVVAEQEINGAAVSQRMDIRAFGEIAEQLAGITHGAYVHLIGEYGMQKSQKDSKWYPIVTVIEVIEA